MEETLREIDTKYEGVEGLEREIWAVKEAYDAIVSQARKQLLEQ